MTISKNSELAQQALIIKFKNCFMVFKPFLGFLSSLIIIWPGLTEIQMEFSGLRVVLQDQKAIRWSGLSTV